MVEEKLFPSLITALPQANDVGEPVRTCFLQGERMQMGFVAFDADVSAPEEAHAAQWVAVLEGEVELTTAGATTVYRKGTRTSSPPASSTPRASRRGPAYWTSSTRSTGSAPGRGAREGGSAKRCPDGAEPRRKEARWERPRR
jgi:hypothetical protein